MKSKEYYQSLLAVIPKMKSRDLVEVSVVYPCGQEEIIRRKAPMPPIEVRDWMMAGYTVSTYYEITDWSHEIDRRAAFTRVADEMRMDALEDVGLHNHPMVDCLMMSMYTNPLALKLAVTHRLTARANELIEHLTLLDLILNYNDTEDQLLFTNKLKSFYSMGFKCPKYV